MYIFSSYDNEGATTSLKSTLSYLRFSLYFSLKQNNNYHYICVHF